MGADLGFRCLATWAIAILIGCAFYGRGDTREMDSQIKLNKYFVRVEGNRDGGYGENFSPNGTYIGDGKVVVLIDGR